MFAYVHRAKRLPGVAGITLMTHFAQADEAAGVSWQLQPFLQELSSHGLPWSTANSAALLRYPETLGASCCTVLRRSPMCQPLNWGYVQR